MAMPSNLHQQTPGCFHSEVLSVPVANLTWQHMEVELQDYAQATHLHHREPGV